MILVRHAESEWNHHFSRTRIDPGIPDPALTERGRRQAEELAERLVEQDVKRLVTSPYRRALQTTMIVARRLEVTIEVEPLVRERCWFSCDIGTHPETLAELWPDLDFDHLDALWWGDQGESEASLDQRCTAFRAQSDGLPDRHQVVVITHWGFIRALTGREVTNAELVRLG